MLMVAAGKSGGALMTCSVTLQRGADSSSCVAIDELFKCSPVCLHRAAHSSRNVTGVTWAATDLPFPAALAKELSPPGKQSQQQQQLQQQLHEQQQHAMLISVGADRQVRVWTVTMDQTVPGLVEADCPAAWSRPSLEKDTEFAPGGVAVSGNGLVMAVAVDNGTTAVASVQYVTTVCAVAQ